MTTEVFMQAYITQNIINSILGLINDELISQIQDSRKLPFW